MLFQLQRFRFWSTLGFLVLALLSRHTLAGWSDIKVEYITYTIWVLVFDALAIVPFSKLRAERKPIKYTAIKIANVSIMLLLNVFFLAFYQVWRPIIQMGF